MGALTESLQDIGRMDALAAGSTPLHRLDPRVKLLTTFFFIAAVVSFPGHEVSALVPFFLYPFYLAAAGGLPAGYLLKKTLLVSPFALAVAIFNPFLDTRPFFSLGPFQITGGILSLTSIMLRFFLTVSAALCLLGLTGINALCGGLAALGVPKPFVVQLLFLNRYFFTLAAEAENMSRAAALRSPGRRSIPFRVFVQTLGNLLLRTLDRAERIYRAMLCRGFDGHVRGMRPLACGRAGLLFLLSWSALFVLFRSVDLPLMLGEAVTGVFR